MDTSGISFAEKLALALNPQAMSNITARQNAIDQARLGAFMNRSDVFKDLPQDATVPEDVRQSYQRLYQSPWPTVTRSGAPGSAPDSSDQFQPGIDQGSARTPQNSLKYEIPASIRSPEEMTLMQAARKGRAAGTTQSQTALTESGARPNINDMTIAEAMRVFPMSQILSKGYPDLEVGSALTGIKEKPSRASDNPNQIESVYARALMHDPTEQNPETKKLGELARAFELLKKPPRPDAASEGWTLDTMPDPNNPNQQIPRTVDVGGETHYYEKKGNQVRLQKGGTNQVKTPPEVVEAQNLVSKFIASSQNPVVQAMMAINPDRWTPDQVAKLTQVTVPKEIQPAYNQAIRILSNYYRGQGGGVGTDPLNLRGTAEKPQPIGGQIR